MSLRRHRHLRLAILLIAGFLRLYGLTDISPPGLAHDEVANWLIDRAILDENYYAVYFTEAYGHEAGFHYIQALFVALLGDNALALRLPTAFLGLLVVAVTYPLIRKLWHRDVALISIAWLAILLWPVFFSRQGLRAMLLPVLSTLAAYYWWRGWTATAETRWSLRHDQREFIWAGIWAGLSLYTYMAARAVPIFFGLFIIYLALFHFDAWRARWRGILIFLLLLGTIPLPLAHFLLTTENADIRVAEVDAPLRALRAGDPLPVLSNSFHILRGFGYGGDPLWRQNVAERPVFTPIIAICFYIGLLYSLWHWRDPRYAFVLLWLLASAAPSIVTINAPSTIRMINALPVLTLLPALLLSDLWRFATYPQNPQVMHIIPLLSTDNPQLSTKSYQNFTVLILTLLFLYDIGSTTFNIFSLWPQNEEVRFVWQEALTAMGTYLNENSPPSAHITIAGWTPDTMDPPTMQLNLKRSDIALRYLGPPHTLLLPPPSPNTHLLRPTVLPFVPELETILTTHPHADRGSFTIYTLTHPYPAPTTPITTTFNDELTLQGLTYLTPCHANTTCQLLTHWRVTATPAAPRRIFIHLLAPDGTILTQHDGLDAPAPHWRPGDTIIQHHTLTLPPDTTPHTLRLGLYQPPQGPRLLTPTNQDHLDIPIP
ncbi:MAG TPA: glycosyltransferase family 39 protein [Anaerolineae bacterium]|nr:glycosyltransferase family 39 protein [Anaerolineae bacterium]